MESYLIYIGKSALAAGAFYLAYLVLFQNRKQFVFNRIIMMKKKTENKFAPLKQLIVLPLLAVLVMGLSNREVRTEIIQQKVEQHALPAEI